MPFLSDRLIDGILALSLAILLLSLFLAVYAVARRARHERDFKQLAAFRLRLRQAFKALADHMLDYGSALAAVQEALCPRLSLAMEQALLDHLNTPGDVDWVRQMAEDLGFVTAWRRGLGVSAKRNQQASEPRPLRRPPSYLTRARSAENLGRIQHGKSWRLLACALDDPHPDVQGAALRSLSAIGELESFPILAECLRITTTQTMPALSERSLRTALGRFPVPAGRALLLVLQDCNPKLRRLAADVLVEMLRSTAETPECSDLESAGPEVSRLILTKLARDEDAEVRARAATLLSYAQGEGAKQKREQLLEDEEWFVRLHAVRAVVARKDADGVRLLATRLTDSSWRVRDAAAHALSQCGAEGLDQLIGTFLITQDAYAREQIAEELETSGNLAGLMGRCAEAGRDREAQALNTMIAKAQTRGRAAAPLRA